MLPQRRLLTLAAALSRRATPHDSFLCIEGGAAASAVEITSLNGVKALRVTSDGFAWRAAAMGVSSTSSSSTLTSSLAGSGCGAARRAADSGTAHRLSAFDASSSRKNGPALRRAMGALASTSTSPASASSSSSASFGANSAALRAAASTSRSRSFAAAGGALAGAVATALIAAAAAPLSFASYCDAADDDGTGDKAPKASSPSISSSPPPASTTDPLPSCPLCHAAPWILALSMSPETTEILSGEALAASASVVPRASSSSSLSSSAAVGASSLTSPSPAK